MFRLVLRTLVALPFAAMALSANAVLIVGTSNGVFSSLSSCDNSGSDQTCRITSSSNGANTLVQWGSQSTSTNFYNSSRLVSVDRSISANTDNSSSLGVVLGQLDWYNSATIARSDLNTFGVRWTLSLAFSQPNYDSAVEAFSLMIANPINPAGDELRGMNLADLSSLRESIDLAGVSISNLRYGLVDPAGGGISTFTSGVWYNDENNWSSLLILADFGSTRPSNSVPEPASIALLGMGLLAMAATRRRSRKDMAA